MKNAKYFWFAPYVALALFHLAVIALENWDLVALTKPLLMPVLLIGLLPFIKKSKLAISVTVIIAIVFSWLGDVLLQSPGEIGFLIGLGMFLLAQISYIVTFVKTQKPRLHWSITIFALWYIALVAALAPSLGGLLAPVLVYGLVLASMATLAARLGPVIATGGILFFASDSMLALNRFLPGFNLPYSDLLIMSTYVAAEGLLVFGLASKIFIHAK
ncbi:MAG: lysoplasmalogenase [Micrococcales bacterium]